MGKNHFLNGIKHALGFLFVFSIVGLVYAVGWHVADEIVSGTFLGNYSFAGDINLTNANVIGFDNIPAGAIIAFNNETCPSDWIPADGTGGTMDLRGQFLRGLNTFDGGITNRTDGNEDPDGGGRLIGSFQLDELKTHKHNLGTTLISAGSTAYVAYPDGGLTRLRSNGVENTGGTETRPKNVAVIFCIKQ